MTRCYEFYCGIETNPELCEGRDKKQLCQINAYKTALKNLHGIKFDRSSEDKARFKEIQKNFPESNTYRKTNILRSQNGKCETCEYKKRYLEDKEPLSLSNIDYIQTVTNLVVSETVILTEQEELELKTLADELIKRIGYDKRRE